MNTPLCPSTSNIPKISGPLHPFFERMIDKKIEIDKKINQMAVGIFSRIFNFIIDRMSSFCASIYPAYRERLQFRMNMQITPISTPFNFDSDDETMAESMLVVTPNSDVTEKKQKQANETEISISDQQKLEDELAPHVSLSIDCSLSDQTVAQQPVTVVMSNLDVAGEQQRPASEIDISIPGRSHLDEEELAHHVSPSLDSNPIDQTMAQPVTVFRLDPNMERDEHIHITINHIPVYFQQGSEVESNCTDQNTQSIEILINKLAHTKWVEIQETKTDGRKNIWRVDPQDLQTENPFEDGEITRGAQLFYQAYKIASAKQSKDI